MNSPIVFFDGECGLCSRVVQFVYKNENNNNIYFSPLQSKYAIDVLNQNNIKPDLNTFYFYYNNKMHDKSSAALKIIPFLKWYYYFLLIFWIVPKFIRDFFYKLIADNRLKFYKDVCEFLPEFNKRIIKE
ncbi:MAG: DCC1-like thiol-disulfide oxidoreductase family protein [Crocinitomicaceae bacterium]|nr:DCC1-like thiol-disulfide oxidoreductase family protein [Crocinitomicaceae bacterium]